MSLPLSLLLLLQSAGGGVEFQAPAGWVAVEAPPLRAFAPPRLGTGEALIVATLPVERLPAAGFDAWFASRIVNPGEQILDQSPIERRSHGSAQALAVSQRVRMPQGGDMVRLLYAVSSGDQVVLALLSSNQDRLVQRHAAEARGFFESLRLPTAAASAAAPAPSPAPAAPAPAGASFVAIPATGFASGEPRGLFYRLVTGTGSAQMETRTYAFLPGRRVFRMYPFGGGSRIDAGRCNPDTCGSYRVEGTVMVIRWDNGVEHRTGFARSGEGFTFDGDTWQPARALSPAEAVGTWTNPGAPSARLHLQREGRFTFGAGSAATTLQGRYSLEGPDLVLRFDDGSSKTYTFFAAGRSRPAGLVSMDGTVYARSRE